MNLLHTMLRVGDLQQSIDFYTKVLGMSLLRTTERPEQGYSLAFVAYGGGNKAGEAEIELTYKLARNLSVGVAYWFDDYDVQDFALGPTTLTGIAFPPVQEGVPLAATNALLLGYLYRPYTAHAGFFRLTYGW